MGVGNRLKNILQMKGMTIKQLSEKTGVSINTLYSITKRDSDHVKMENVEKIAAALGVPVHKLLDITPLFDSAVDEANRELDEWLADMERQGMAVSESEIDRKRQELLSKGNIVGYAEDLVALGAAPLGSRLNSAFEKLNDVGQQEAIKRIEELTEISKYKKAIPKDGDGEK